MQTFAAWGQDIEWTPVKVKQSYKAAEGVSVVTKQQNDEASPDIAAAEALSFLLCSCKLWCWTLGPWA